MKVLILSGRETVYEGNAYQAVMPGMDGEFSVLDFHQPFLYRLRKGIIKIKEAKRESKEQFFAVVDGIARFCGNSLLIIKK